MHLDHIAIIVSSIKSLDFYIALGFQVVSREARPQCHDEIVIMEGNGIVLEIYVDVTHPQRVNNPEAYGLRHFALQTDDLDSVLVKIKEAGYISEPVRMTPSGERFTFVKDDDGLPIELREGRK